MVVEKEKNEITINFGQHQLNVDGKLYFGGFSHFLFMLPGPGL